MKHYKGLDIEIIYFAKQDIVTFSENDVNDNFVDIEDFNP